MHSTSSPQIEDAKQHFKEYSLDILESLLQHASKPVLFFSDLGYIYKVNRSFEEIFGWTEDESIGTHISKVPWVWKSDIEKIQAIPPLLMNGLERAEDEFILMTKDHKYLSSLVSFIAGQFFHGYFVTITDLTATKQTQEALLKAEQLSVTGQLAAGIAHEINNPLTAIEGFLQLIASQEQNNIESYLEIIRDEISQIKRITRSLMHLSKPQSDDFSKQDLRAMLTDVIFLLTSSSDNDASLATHFSDVPPIECSPQLRQVFINLIKNSLEAVRPPGDIHVTLETLNDEHVGITIQDDGEGIPSELLSRLGEAFVTTKKSGTGLGLMVSKMIVKDHGGTMTLDSEDGKGTTVQIILPIQRRP